jgi:NAD(P)-dependent dehydrogenase (short-subunit alcohol dehydrogenase family)
MNDTQQQRSALVFGARNLGRAVVEGLRDEGWAVAAVARSESTLATARAAGALAMQGDVTDPESIREALTKTAEAHGAVDLVVNAASAYGGTRSGPFGGGPLAQAAPTAFDDWAAAPGRAAFTFLSAAARFALEQARPATLIQVTGGSARRAMPGRGLWAAGAFAVRAITQAAALELREQRIHVALLIVDAGIEPFEGRTRGRRPRGAGGPARDRRCGRLPGQPGCARRDPRAAGHAAGRALGAVRPGASSTPAPGSRCIASRTACGASTCDGEPSSSRLATWSRANPGPTTRSWRSWTERVSAPRCSTASARASRR